MLSTVERGQRVPSILVMARIATALDTSIGRLVGEEATPRVIVMRGVDQRVVKDPAGIERRSLSPVLPGIEFELIRMTLAPGIDAGTFPPHRAESREYLARDRHAYPHPSQRFSPHRQDGSYHRRRSGFGPRASIGPAKRYPALCLDRSRGRVQPGYHRPGREAAADPSQCTPDRRGCRIKSIDDRADCGGTAAVERSFAAFNEGREVAFRGVDFAQGLDLPDGAPNSRRVCRWRAQSHPGPAQLAPSHARRPALCERLDKTATFFPGSRLRIPFAMRSPRRIGLAFPRLSGRARHYHGRCPGALIGPKTGQLAPPMSGDLKLALPPSERNCCLRNSRLRA